MAVDRSARDQGAVLIGVDGIATRKHRRPGEFRIRHLVVVESALLEQLVPGPNRAAVEPPLLATEDQVAVRNMPDARRRSAVPVIQCHRDGLRRDEAAELGVAGELLVPVQRVGIVHRHHPPPNVGRAARIPQLPATDRLADAVVDVGQIEFDTLVACTAFAAMYLLRSAIDVDDDAPAHFAVHESTRGVDHVGKSDLFGDRIEHAPDPGRSTGVPRRPAAAAWAPSRCRCRAGKRRAG